jgi:xanthine/uracil/vitamin C permease (AzgA family)
MGKSWKTSASGIIAIIVAVCGIATAIIAGTPVDWTTSIAAITAGVGLLMAKDSNVTGGTIKQ